MFTTKITRNSSSIQLHTQKPSQALQFISVMPSAKNIAFDVEGTLVGYEKFFEAIDQRIGEQLRAHCVKPAVFGMLW